MSDLGGTDQDADTDVTITSTRDEDEDATKTPSPTRGIRGSFVWNYFRREYDETGINTINGICKTCRTPIRVQKGSTTAMRNHLANKHPELHNEMLKNEEKNDKENV